MLDDAARARLEHAVSGTWPLVTLQRGDLLDLLAALAAAEQARDEAVAAVTQTTVYWQGEYALLAERCAVAEQRATRLEAQMAYVHAQEANLAAGYLSVSVWRDTLAALAAPPAAEGEADAAV